MGCVVNGPGEARNADIGIAGGIGEGLLIKKGQVIRKVPEKELLHTLRQELESLRERGDKHGKTISGSISGITDRNGAQRASGACHGGKGRHDKGQKLYRIYIVSPRLIHKKNIYKIEDGIAKQPGFPAARFR